MNTETKYKTSEVAATIGIHPNTVRLYEKLELIPKPDQFVALNKSYRSTYEITEFAKKNL